MLKAWHFRTKFGFVNYLPCMIVTLVERGGALYGGFSRDRTVVKPVKFRRGLNKRFSYPALGSYGAFNTFPMEKPFNYSPLSYRADTCS